MKWLALAALAVAACGDDGSAFPIEQLQDPATCMECHGEHYTQWSGSMHAYASDDPVFVAMNKRGQRDTGGRLGDFCLKCHAPMAVELGLADPANFDPAALPPAARGITCYFCHNVAKVGELHNNGLVLARDQTMRGGAKNPVSTPAHRSKYDTLMDASTNQSEMCGSCHDIVVPSEITGTPEPLALERTFAEWQETFFATESDARFHNNCGSCHMRSRPRDVIADKPGLDVPSRPNGFHDHRFPGVDKALTDFPERADQAVEVKKLIDQSLNIIGAVPRTGPPAPGGICVLPNGTLSVRVDSIGTGHKWPSGASQDRRAWLEVRAFDAEVGGTEVFSSGVVADDVDPPPISDTLFGFWDSTFHADNTPAHFFWDVARIDSKLLPGPVTTDPNDPRFDHSITKEYRNIQGANTIQRVEVRMRIRPLPFAMLDELIASGDLAAPFRELNQTIDVGTARTWLRSTSDPTLGNCGPPN